jgi:P pilus assembly chaperone PapD
MKYHRATPGILVGTFCLLLSLGGVAPSLAQGVAVLPSRIVLDGQARSATAFVSNRGDREATYRVSLSYWRMDDRGRLFRADSLAATADNFAGKVLRYSPRRMVIPAGESQTLRLLVRRPPGLTVDNSEFHAHLAIRSVPTVPHLREVTDEVPEMEEDVVVARAQVSVETLVPIVVRFGRPEAQLELADVRLEPGEAGVGSILWIAIDRRGTRSVYGDMAVDYVGPEGRETGLVWSRGVAIYTEVPRRILAIDLSRHEHIDPTRGRVVIDYRETPKGNGDLVLHEEVALESLSPR